MILIHERIQRAKVAKRFETIEKKMWRGIVSPSNLAPSQILTFASTIASLTSKNGQNIWKEVYEEVKAVNSYIE